LQVKPDYHFRIFGGAAVCKGFIGEFPGAVRLWCRYPVWGIVSLDGVWFDVAPDSILGLIGPNGAGKTTLFNCVSRLYTPTSGDDAAAPRGRQPDTQRGGDVFPLAVRWAT